MKFEILGKIENVEIIAICKFYTYP